ncbi:hypothetical protein HK097_003895 [Rhizophlyctis rosea]|uniref:DNA/RNA-binding protein Alba-like domain-containing protein n=1 Tax=Rhizophlyctis rosea TaxID=64517 RepID=A0AAD5S3Q5_9FUNG|nr:hypothetical protein HK097_003895 [Rhizophlyctis rosea]
MEKYRRKEVGLDQEPPLQPNEIRMSQNGKPKQYVQQVVDLLLDQTHPRVTITGLGATINKAVTVAEITKRRITQELKLGPLRQETDIENIKATDMWESVDGDLDA